MKLQDELDNLNQMIIKMADVVENNLSLAFSLYKKYDEDTATQINDDIVDLHERLVEEVCMSILIKERFFAKDMRMVIGILKLVADLERLGDHAEDINTFSKKLINEEKHHFDDIAMNMVHNSIDSFIKKDLSAAQQVILDDDLVDKLYEKLINEIITLAENKQVSSAFAIYTTLVVKYIERIADHASNIAEWVIYILSGYYKDKQIF